MRFIQSGKMPKAGGHYSQCIEHNGLLYIAGQLPRNPETQNIPDGIEAQAQQVLQNINVILTEAGSSKDKILQVRIYIVDIKDWDVVNRIYREFMGNHKPVRAVIPCGPLHFNSLIEVEATAFVK